MTKSSSPSSYELLRIQRIQRNNERLASLGLLDKPKFKPSKFAKTPPKKAAKKIVSPSPRRVSKRLQNQPAPDDLVPPTTDVSHSTYIDQTIISRRPRPRRIVEQLTPTTLTPEQKAIITKKIPEKDFLDKLQDYLLNVDQISSANLTRVLRSMVKLSSGQGVRAPHWPDDCYFLRGENVGPAADVEELIERGRDCEEEWGRDRGNGWLYNHPLRKLALFQSYLLEKS